MTTPYGRNAIAATLVETLKSSDTPASARLVNSKFQLTVIAQAGVCGAGLTADQ